MKRIILGGLVGGLLLGSMPAQAACRGLACLPGSIRVIATDVCEDGEDCKTICAPFEDDPLICFP